MMTFGLRTMSPISPWTTPGLIVYILSSYRTSRMKMSPVPAAKNYEFPKAHGHELVENLSASATLAAIGLISYWLLKMMVGYLPLSFGWVRELPSIIAIGIFFLALWSSQRVAFRNAISRWRYVAAFGIVFWLGTLFQPR